MSGTIYKIQHRRGTQAEWSSINPVLSDGEIGKVVGTSLFKMGDGILPWLELPYILSQDDTAGSTDGLAPIASPAFTGNPTAPTPPVDDSDTSIATSAFVLGQASDVNPIIDGTVSPGTSKRWSRGDHIHPQDLTLAKKRSVHARFVLVANQSIPNGVGTLVALEAVVAVQEGGFTVSAGKVIVPVEGVYIITGMITFTGSNTTGTRYGGVNVNAGMIARQQIPGSALTVQSVIAVTTRLAVGEEVTLQAYQTSGAAVNIVSGTANTGMTLTLIPGTEGA